MSDDANADEDGDSKEKGGDDDKDDDDDSSEASIKKRDVSETEISPKSYPVDDLLLVCILPSNSIQKVEIRAFF